MQRLTFAELDQERDRFDGLVAQTPDIDLFCSTSMWILPAHEAFGPAHVAFIERTAGGYIALAHTTVVDEHKNRIRILQPLELSWGFPSPLIGPEPLALAEDLSRLLLRSNDWDMAALGGIVPDTMTYETLRETLGRNFRLYRGETTRRYRARLESGFEAYMERRSRDFRKNARRGFAKAQNAGIRFVAAPQSASAADADALYDRLLAVDDRSWKGQEGVGLNASAMAVHYRGITRRLAQRGALRLWFAEHHGRDVGYVLGGVFAKTYRGLQFAYDNDYAAYGLGNLAQLTTLEAVAAEGVAIYDLGSDVPYKARWGEEIFETVTILVTR